VSQLTVGVFRTPGRATELDVPDQRVCKCHHRPPVGVLSAGIGAYPHKYQRFIGMSGFPV